MLRRPKTFKKYHDIELTLGEERERGERQEIDSGVSFSLTMRRSDSAAPRHAAAWP